MNRRILSLAVLVLASLIVIGSLGPFEFRRNFGAFLGRPLPLFGRLHLTPHRFIHLAAFGLLGILVVLISSRAYQRFLGLAAVILLGLCIESVQYLSSTNPFESWDVRDDTCAACLGYFSAAAYVYRRCSGFKPGRKGGGCPNSAGLNDGSDSDAVQVQRFGH